MWSSLLGIAFLAAIDPLRLGIILLVISRPRPMQNLLAYGVGCLTACSYMLALPLTVLNFTPTVRSFTQDFATQATSSTVRHIQVGVGVLALSIAALMTVRLLARQRVHLPTPGDNTSTVVLDSNTPTAISRLVSRARDAGTEGGSAIWRLLGRAHNTWENGSLWIAFAIGIGTGGPSPESVVGLLAVLVVSGAAIGAQVCGAIMLIVGMLTVVEIALVSYLTRPAKTQAALRLVHDWVMAHRQKALLATSAVIGVSLLAQGTGSI